MPLNQALKSTRLDCIHDGVSRLSAPTRFALKNLSFCTTLKAFGKVAAARCFDETIFIHFL